jgi:hypothetical protein
MRAAKKARPRRRHDYATGASLLLLMLLAGDRTCGGADQFSGVRERQGALSGLSPLAAESAVRLPPPLELRGSRRIVGGQASGGSYQWVTLVQKIGGTSITCAGELIADRWMVTAAHCLLNSYNTGYRSVGPGNTEIIYGCIDLTSTACKKVRPRYQPQSGLVPDVLMRWQRPPCASCKFCH